jgi:hypothetical protein
MNETQTTSPRVGAPDTNPAKRTTLTRADQLARTPAKRTHADRTQTVVTLTRADDLRLGDTFPLQNWKGVWENTTVRSLEFEGEDVLVNGTLSTSPGNCFQVLSAR